MKSQSTIYFIMGIVVIAVLAIFFAMQTDVLKPTTIPYSIMQREKFVRESVKDVITEGADMSLEYLSIHGGYFDPPLDRSVLFAGIVVPYWQRCGEKITVSKGTFKVRLEEGVKNYIINTLTNDVGERVEFDLSDVVVSANILDNKIVFTATIPTKIDGYLITEPYEITISSSLGRIIDFSNDLVNDNINERYFDWFTITGFYMSSSFLPMQGLIMECDECIYLSKEQVSTLMENIVDFVVTNTFWWRDIQPSPEGAMTFGIEDLGGRTYPDLQIRFFESDGFEIEVDRPVKICDDGDHEVDPGYSGLDFQQCLTIYEHYYSLYYPLVLRVDDKLSGHAFHFALLVGIDGLEPDEGECNLDLDPIEDDCVNLDCSAKITMENDLGEPVFGARVQFGDCPIGTTNSRGIVEGSVKCGIDMLYVNKEGYDPFRDAFDSDDLEDLELELVRKESETVLFNLQMINALDCAVTDVRDEKALVEINLDDSSATNVDAECFSLCLAGPDPDGCISKCLTTSLTLRYAPGTYVVKATASDAESGLLLGEFLKEHEFSVSSSLDAYIPKSETGFDATELVEMVEDNCGGVIK
ncbi:MAG: hypothetical protein ISS36_00300 [Candidatus Aenigmarchaeota archaeon]|nr:hypothetical protein [Candidatus Aenigmarchaeota archaeon]